MYCAQYGNRLSFYGNIEYGFYHPPINLQPQGYGGWPDDIAIPEHVPDPAYRPEPQVYIYDAAKNIAHIKRLRAELQQATDLSHRQHLRYEIEKARIAKVRAFQMQARIEEEEATFMLLH